KKRGGGGFYHRLKAESVLLTALSANCYTKAGLEQARLAAGDFESSRLRMFSKRWDYLNHRDMRRTGRETVSGLRNQESQSW
ncbi:hypothetical protein, partial [Sulfitobacter sp. HI0076]|uniref:hypothetical protein n=1 Tax=Sulfitobacter sp. HI0076 TaxID=1822251 RepID=UPI001F1D1D1A